MRKSRKIIGICGSYLFNQQPLQFISHLREEGLAHGYCITALSCGSYENSTDYIGNSELIKLIRYIPFSGMVILTETIKDDKLLADIVRLCQEKQIPIFSIDGKLEHCYNMTMRNGDGFELMVRHIIESHGCRRVNMLAGFKGNAISDERIAVYKKVLQENHIPIEEERIAYGDFWDRPTRKAIREFFNSPLPLPEAIICANDSMAIAACAELRKYGYHVPDDIIVTGFDGILSGQYHFPVLSTCAPDFADAAAFIIQELEHFVVSKQFTPCDHDIVYIPKINPSCSCKPKTMSNLNQIISKLYDNNTDSAWHNISMNQLITDNLSNDNILALVNLLPKHVHLWKDNFRFACVKSSMLSSGKVDDDFTDMISILDLRSGSFGAAAEKFPIEDFIPNIDDIENTDTLIVRLLNSGKTVYGYSAEGFCDIDDRKMQRCNDFSFFLSYCLNTIVHNATQKELADGLRKANHEISLMSLHDPMTGLYNRRGFYHEMESLLKDTQNSKNYLYIFSIDMNRLKYINDNFGHAEGDFAISVLIKAILDNSDNDAVCARFGGDEFVIARIGETENRYSASEFLEKILASIALTEGIRHKPYPISVSIGMCCLPVTPSINLENMISAADEKMYEMKRSYK